jgi:hypothetical protein
MFEILIDLYIFATHSIVQPNLVGLVNASDTQHVFEGCSLSSSKHIAKCNLRCPAAIRVIKDKVDGWVGCANKRCTIYFNTF